MARKSKYETYVKARFKELKELVRNGATDKEVIAFLGITSSTFYDYMNKYSEFSELMRENRAKQIQELKDTLYKKAIGFQYTEIVKTTEGGCTKVQEYTKTALPSETAILILLKHWDKNKDGSAKWMNDPASWELKNKEYQLKKEQMDNEGW